MAGSVQWYFKWLGAAATGAGGVVLFKEFMGGQNYVGDETLSGKTCIVTGASSGVGKETARALAARGARVVMACPNMARCKVVQRDIVMDTRNKAVVCRECDLTSFQSVRSFAALMKHKEERVDILINNAATNQSLRKISKEEGIELMLMTNHLGPFLLTNLLLDKIKATENSRIVFVSCVGHKKGALDFANLNQDQGKWDPKHQYEMSKLAGLMFSHRLARELKGTSTVVSAADPGLCNTSLTRHSSIHSSFLSFLTTRPLLWLVLKTAQKAAQTPLHAAIAPTATTPGAYYVNQEEAEPGENSLDIALQDRLWKVSEAWCRMGK